MIDKGATRAPLQESRQGALDIRLMKAALSLARSAEGRTYPNPPVGCVIARGAEIIGFAATGCGGVPHAEPQAIEAASERASKFGDAEAVRGASMYVTLEPCAHDGKTPPCSAAIVKAGIGRVVYALRDPDLRTNGKGVARLEEAGIATIEGVCATEAQELLAPYCKRVKDGLPFCSLKLATSLDGKISAINPHDAYPMERTMISGVESRALRDDLLQRADAIMIGARTMRCDNPSLLPAKGRIIPNSSKNSFASIRILLDGCLTLPLESRLVQSIDQAPLWILTREGEILSDKGKALQTSGVRFLPVPAISSLGGGVRLSLRKALQGLASEGISSLLCEGGGRLAHALCHEGLVDRLILFSAPHTLGSQGLSMLEGRESRRIDFCPVDHFANSLGGYMSLGEDRIFILRPRDESRRQSRV